MRGANAANVGTARDSAALRVVTTDPAGATLSTLDGTTLGTAPLEVDVTAGPVELRASLPGHSSQSVTVSADSPPSLTLLLPRTTTTSPGPATTR